MGQNLLAHPLHNWDSGKGNQEGKAWANEGISFSSNREDGDIRGGVVEDGDDDKVTWIKMVMMAVFIWLKSFVNKRVPHL